MAAASNEKPKRDYYKVLGLGPDASKEDIKAAFRRLAKDYHPDRNHGDDTAEARFKELNEAYEVLRDPAQRAAYDEKRLRHKANPSQHRAASYGNQYGYGYGDFMSRGAARAASQGSVWPYMRIFLSSAAATVSIIVIVNGLLTVFNEKADPDTDPEYEIHQQIQNELKTAPKSPHSAKAAANDQFPQWRTATEPAPRLSVQIVAVKRDVAQKMADIIRSMGYRDRVQLKPSRNGSLMRVIVNGVEEQEACAIRALLGAYFVFSDNKILTYNGVQSCPQDYAPAR